MSKHVCVREIPRPDAAVSQALAKYGVATVHEAQGRTGLLKPTIRPVWPGAYACGTAVTVLAQPGDNWMLHVAAEQIREGDLVIVGVTTDNDDGMFGDLLATSFRARGAVGLVMVGAVWLIYQVEFRHWQGFTVAIAAAVFAALFATSTKQQVSHRHWSVIGTYQMGGSFVAALLCRPILEKGPLPSLPDARSALGLAFLVLVCTVAAYAGFMKALRTMSVFSMNVIYNLEPVYGILLAMLVFGSSEFMSPGFYVGAGVIITSVLILPWLRGWVERR